ncbi:MAG: hypothetical protein VX589_14360 [Myxococcota bacterium]|nr:hypothetical protein [Myxococcota bacterium]
MRIKFLFSIVLVAILGCADDWTHTTASHAHAELTANELGFALPGKTDHTCDPMAALCWSSHHAHIMRQVLAADDQFRVATDDAHQRLDALFRALDGLETKLTANERDRLDELENRQIEHLEDARVRAEVSDQIFVDGLHRITAGYMTAHAVPLGQIVEAQATGKGDWLGGAPVELVSMVLSDLSVHGPFHRYIAMMLHTSGALEPLPRPSQDTFPYSEPLETLARRITDRYTSASVAQSAVSQTITFAPVVGFAVGVPYGLLTQFRLRARMILEIAALYGIDPRTPTGLKIAVAVLGAATEVPEATDAVVDAIAAHRATTPPSGAHTARGVYVRELVGLALGRIGAASGKVLARIQLRAAAKAARSSILGYATLGLAAAGELVLEGVLTARIGWRARVMTRPWAEESLRAGASFLTDENVTHCLHASMGYIMQNQPSEDAAAFIAAHLDRSMFNRGWQAAFGTQSIQLALDMMHENGQSMAPPHCIKTQFNGLREHAFLQVLAWLTMVAHHHENLAFDTQRRLDIVLSDARNGWALRSGAHPTEVMMHQLQRTFDSAPSTQVNHQDFDTERFQITALVRARFGMEPTAER